LTPHFRFQVKQELAKELHALLVSSERRSRDGSIADTDSETETGAESTDSSGSADKMDLDIVIPLSMVALVEYASTTSACQVRK
jgi:hypothetical protein